MPVKLIRELSIPVNLLERAEDTHISSFCFVAHSPGLQDILGPIYGREGLCLKVFRELEEEELPDLQRFRWNKAPLGEAARVQNLFALCELAPRVYDIVLLNGRRWAQVTDYVLPEGQSDAAKLIDIVKQFHIGTKVNWDLHGRNWRGRLFVDFGSLYFEDKEAYLAEMETRALAMIYGAHKGQLGKAAYQAVPELHIPGQRVITTRIAAMGWEDDEFGGHTVLDLGCNLGGMLRAACRRGALRSVGIDRQNIGSVATEICNWLGYWNIDILRLGLPQEAHRIEERTGIWQFDVVFAFAIFNPMGGYDSWIADLCKEELYLEGHGGDLPSRYEKDLRRDFSEVAFLGYTTDYLRRPLFRCRK